MSVSAHEQPCATCCRLCWAEDLRYDECSECRASGERLVANALRRAVAEPAPLHYPLPEIRGYRVVHVHAEGERCETGCFYVPSGLRALRRRLGLLLGRLW